MTGRRIIVIAGSTASGKSALALRLAQACNGCIINADSMQVYRELSILSAQPDAADRSRCRHVLYGHRYSAAGYSAGIWLAEAEAALAGAWSAGQVPIVTGGTGLYFKALLEGLSPVPEIPAAIRQFWRDQAASLGAAALHRVLADRDPVMAQRLLPTDPQRITRALEVLDYTGRSLADWQVEPGIGLIAADQAVKLVVTLDRAVLRARCDQRFDAMLAAGALDEARAFAALRVAPDAPAHKALGLAPLLDHIAGRLTLDAAATVAKTTTRAYAKRQLTWCRRFMTDWHWIAPDASLDGLV